MLEGYPRTHGVQIDIVRGCKSPPIIYSDQPMVLHAIINVVDHHTECCTCKEF